LPEAGPSCRKIDEERAVSMARRAVSSTRCRLAVAALGGEAAAVSSLAQVG
jgi:hypothetical protein